jgi:hypothetical protein
MKLKLSEKLKTLTLKQSAYIDTEHTYIASAKDKKGIEYLVTWAIKNYETENEDEACNWGKPIKIEKL